MRLQAGPEDSHGGDVFRQTVPDTSSGKWKSLVVADGRQSSAADDQR